MVQTTTYTVVGLTQIQSIGSPQHQIYTTLLEHTSSNKFGFTTTNISWFYGATDVPVDIF
jgi:hypothetical protein